MFKVNTRVAVSYQMFKYWVIRVILKRCFLRKIHGNVSVMCSDQGVKVTRRGGGSHLLAIPK